MKNHEQLWQHFINSGNPMSYIAYRHANKKEDSNTKAMTGHPFSMIMEQATIDL